jgi:hypothetical protein
MLHIHVTVFSGARLDEVLFEIARPGEGVPASSPVWSQRGGVGIDPGNHTMIVAWDGSDESGAHVPPGDYQLYVSADVRVTAEPEHPCDPAVGTTSNEGHSLAVLRVGG